MDGMGISYRFTYSAAHTHYLDIETTVTGIKGPVLHLQLPAWRPGRYVLQNFAKNIQKWQALAPDGTILPHRKLTKDLWEVQTMGHGTVAVRTNYHAAELNAGSTYLSAEQMYVNPITCCLYMPGMEHLPCTVQLDIPDNWQVACALPMQGRMLQAESYHRLADSPWIAGLRLQCHTYTVGGTQFHICFRGEFKPDWPRIEADFARFTRQQLNLFGSFPFTHYHFLIHVRTEKAYHGVEHQDSTVITLGPSYDLLKEAMYPELLGISSHELFHAWNIKSIRPVEMLPYDYSKENYSPLGYVAEGVTTYYGDLMLYRGGCFTDFDFFRTLHDLMMKHFHNYGRFNQSVAEASWDTWLDGYEKGVPDRKVSIYTEGALIALMADLYIRRATANARSMDTVLRNLYEQYGATGRGYTEADYLRLLTEAAGEDMTWLMKDYYHGTTDIEPLLTELLAYVGVEMRKTRSRMYFENRFGFKVSYINNRAAKITDVAPGSIADRACLKVDDEISAINGIRVAGNLKEWCKYFQEETVTLTVSSAAAAREVQLRPGTERYYLTYWPHHQPKATPEQMENYRAWGGRDHAYAPKSVTPATA
jgi:predicted metalloprotease with PDZ domain